MQIRKSSFPPKCDPIFADFDCERSKDFFGNVARRLALSNFESDCVVVRISMPRWHEIQSVRSLRRFGSMKQSQIQHQRGGNGRSLPHAAILLILTVVALIALFRGAFPSRSIASASEIVSVKSIVGVRQVPEEYPTIQAAVDAASYGETILVAAGIYHERVSINEKKITLRGIAGDARAQIVGDDRIGPILKITGAGSTGCEFEHLFLTNGRGSNGCGILIDHVDVLIRDCVLSGNSGGGAVNLGSSSTFYGCSFDGNAAEIAGGGFRNEGGSPTMSDCTVKTNTAGTYGGGIYSSAGRMTLMNSTVSGNSTKSGAWGGGIYSAAGELLAFNTIIEKNSSLESGGGVFVASGEASLSGCKFMGNYSDRGWSVGSVNATVSMNDSTVCGDARSAMLGEGINNAGVIFTSACFPDLNQNGRDDAEEIALGLTPDCDGNGVPDAQDPDCNQNGIVDRCEIRAGWVRDCNANGVPDRCEIEWGLEIDTDGDGRIDGCNAE